MGILNALSGGQSAGGSSSQGTSTASSWSNTAGAAASAWSARQAEIAHQRQIELLRETQAYNAKEAQKQREWEEAMANSTYQRSMADMKSAGLNPILASGMGLGSSSVGGGGAASVSTPSAAMGNTFAEQNSASQSTSQSNGSSWNESSNGLATGLELMGTAIAGALAKLNSSNTVNIALDGLKDLFKKENKDTRPDKEVYSDQNKTGKDRNGNTVNHIAKDIKPKAGSFTYGLEQYLRAHGLL